MELSLTSADQCFLREFPRSSSAANLPLVPAIYAPAQDRRTSSPGVLWQCESAASPRPGQAIKRPMAGLSFRGAPPFLLGA